MASSSTSIFALGDKKKRMDAGDEESQPLVGGPSNAEDHLDPDDPPPPFTDYPTSVEQPFRDHPTSIEQPVASDISELPPPPLFTEYRPDATMNCTSQRIKTHDAHLNTDGEALYQYLRAQNEIHPYYYARINGTHSVTTERWVTRDGKSVRETDTRTETDFDFQIDLTEVIYDNREGQLWEVDWNKRCYRGSIFKHKGKTSVGTTVDPIREWCHKYCEDKSYFKEFILNKVVRGFDENQLREFFTTAVRSTNYGGTIDIRFERTRDRITIQPDNMLSRWRTTKWIRVVFYCTLLFLISWPVLFFATKRYHCVESIWRTITLGGDARFTEEQIGEMWFETIRWAAQNGRRSGVVSVSEREMVRSQGLGIPNRRRQIRMGGLSTGLQTGNFLGLALGVTDVARQMVDDCPVWGQDERC